MKTQSKNPYIALNFIEHLYFILVSSILEIVAWFGGATISIFTFYKTAVKPMVDYIKESQKRTELQEQLSVKVDKIYAEVTPNGGGSIKDQLGRMEKRQILAEQKAKITANKQELSYMGFDMNGECIECSVYLCRLLNRSESELLGNLWLNWVVTQDRARVMNEWHEAINSKTEFNSTYSMVKPDGKFINVEAGIDPLFDDHNNILGFFGTIEQA